MPTPSADRLGEAGLVEVVEQDVGRLAAELEGDLLDRLGAELGDPLAGAGGAGERHHVDVGVGGDRLADDRAEAGHEVEHAGRQADLVDDLGEDERVDRGDLARLEHDGAAGGHRVGDLGGDLVQRVVPRGDAADDADRLAHDQRVADRLLELVALGEGGRLVEAVDRQADLHELRQPLRHAGLLGDGGGDLVHAGAERVADAGEVLGPLLDRRRRPRVEGGLGGGDGRVDVGGGARRDGGHDLLGDRVDHVDRLGGAGGDPGAVDVELVERRHGLKIGGAGRGSSAAWESSRRHSATTSTVVSSSTARGGPPPSPRCGPVARRACGRRRCRRARRGPA